MFKKYNVLKNLTSFQKSLVNDFNKNPQVEFEKILCCEICKSNKIKLLFNNDRYGINQKTTFCDDCGFMFLNPRMSEKFTKFFYNSNYYRSLYSQFGEEFNEEAFIIDSIKDLKNYKPLLPTKPNFNNYYPQLYFDFINYEVRDFESVLDIGCGKGKKLIDFNNIGKKTKGIEPSKTYHKAHVELGLDCEIGFIDDIKKKYDLVLLAHVFEHFIDLKQAVETLSDITNKYLFVEVPGHVKKLQSIQNAHNYYFSLNTLNYFILNGKFKLKKINYAKDNEYILALYEKVEKKSEYKFDKNLEKKIVKNIIRSYYFKNVVIKILRLTKLEKIFRIFYGKFKNLQKKD